MKNNFLIYDENEVLLYRLSNEDMWLTVDFDLYDSKDRLVGNITNGFYLFKTSFQISIKGKKLLIYYKSFLIRE
ncbi:hypothetical protein [Breznakia pachnodae]|uniref:Uncharacterized protein YxjI n=1 Tax=Breznakia pachnodae TaxID=265178 RepID=A0ABU0E213_9FIRM|nr:hypothetical protein [Breznakia pachnodae]MDQ0360799.1 uncharacterized protein YxjI [Breznakia pachnodae]